MSVKELVEYLHKEVERKTRRRRDMASTTDHDDVQLIWNENSGPEDDRDDPSWPFGH